MTFGLSEGDYVSVYTCEDEGQKKYSRLAAGVITHMDMVRCEIEIDDDTIVALNPTNLPPPVVLARQRRRYYQDTALHRAARVGDVATITSSTHPLLDVHDTLLQTPLFSAVANRRVDAVRALITKGADRHMPCTDKDVTPAQLATRLGDRNILDSLNAGSSSNNNSSVENFDDWADPLAEAHEVLNTPASDEFGTACVHISRTHDALTAYYPVTMQVTDNMVVMSLRVCRLGHTVSHGDVIDVIKSLMRVKDRYQCGLVVVENEVVITKPLTLYSAVDVPAGIAMMRMCAEAADTTTERSVSESEGNGDSGGGVVTCSMGIHESFPGFNEIIADALAMLHVEDRGYGTLGMTLTAEGNLLCTMVVQSMDDGEEESFLSEVANIIKPIFVHSVRTCHVPQEQDRIRRALFRESLSRNPSNARYLTNLVFGMSRNHQTTLRQYALCVFDDSVVSAATSAVLQASWERGGFTVLAIHAGSGEALSDVVHAMHAVYLQAVCGDVSTVVFHFVGFGSRVMNVVQSNEPLMESGAFPLCALTLSDSAYLELPALREWCGLLTPSVSSVRIVLDCDFYSMPPSIQDPHLLSYHFGFASQWLCTRRSDVYAQGFSLEGWYTTPPNTTLVLGHSPKKTAMPHRDGSVSAVLLEVLFPPATDTVTTTTMMTHESVMVELRQRLAARAGTANSAPCPEMLTTEGDGTPYLPLASDMPSLIRNETFTVRSGGEALGGGFLNHIEKGHKFAALSSTGKVIGLLEVAGVSPHVAAVIWLRRLPHANAATHAKWVATSDLVLPELPCTETDEAENLMLLPPDEPPFPKNTARTDFDLDYSHEITSSALKAPMLERLLNLPPQVSGRVLHDFGRRMYEIRQPESRMTAIRVLNPRYGPRRTHVVTPHALESLTFSPTDSKKHFESLCRRLDECRWAHTKEEELHRDYFVTYPHDKVFDAAETQLSKENAVVMRVLTLLGWRYLIPRSEEAETFATCRVLTRLMLLEFLQRRDFRTLSPLSQYRKVVGSPAITQKILASRHSVLFKEGIAIQGQQPERVFSKLPIQAICDDDGYIRLAHWQPQIALRACAWWLLHKVQTRRLLGSWFAQLQRRVDTDALRPSADVYHELAAVFGLEHSSYMPTPEGLCVAVQHEYLNLSDPESALGALHRVQYVRHVLRTYPVVAVAAHETIGRLSGLAAKKRQGTISECCAQEGTDGGVACQWDGARNVLVVSSVGFVGEVSLWTPDGVRRVVDLPHVGADGVVSTSAPSPPKCLVIPDPLHVTQQHVFCHYY
eukprot:PhM_4_TR12671/c0_g1_i1/m.81038